MWCGKRVAAGDSLCKMRSCALTWIVHQPVLVNKSNVSSLRRFAHYYYGFKCMDCDIKLAKVAPSGIFIPTFRGELDHDEALTNGGPDHWDNLRLRCKKCHKSKTKRDLARNRESAIV